MDIETIRKRNLSLLNDNYDLKQELADALDISPSYLSQLMGDKRPFNEKTAKKLTNRLRLPSDWFDIEHEVVSRIEIADLDDDVLIQPYELTADGMAIDKDTLEMLSEPVKQSWLDKHGFKEESLITVHYSLSNMAPIYLMGDTLIVNIDFDGAFKNNRAYVFKGDDESPIIWKVHNRRGGALLISCEDKEEYPDELVKSEDVPTLEVIGVIVRLVRDAQA